MRRFVLGVAYDGRCYCGWQRQQHGESVQQRLTDALSKVAAQPLTLTAAGRTDAGVHALYQVVHFDTVAARTAGAFRDGGNAALPPDISIRWAREVAPTFDARRSALSRTYRYLIHKSNTPHALLAGRALWVRGALDVAAMRQALPPLIGEHDFSAFRDAECQSHSAMRRVDTATVTAYGELLVLTITANAFLHHMVRTLVGSLLLIGRHRHSPEWLRDVLLSRDRRNAGENVPPHGLYLSHVRYGDEWALPAEDSHWLATVASMAVI